MSWCEQLTYRPPLPDWSGPKRVQDLFAKESPKPHQDQEAPKVCSSCKAVKTATREHFYAHTVRGKSYLHSKCKVCMLAEQAARDSRRSGRRSA